MTVLTADLIDYLDAPFPFIAGVDATVWENILSRRGSQLDDEITTVYIDTSIDGSIMKESSVTKWEQVSKSNKGNKNVLFSFAKMYVEKLDKIKKKFFE